jgi:hypothetical protein
MSFALVKRLKVKTLLVGQKCITIASSEISTLKSLVTVVIHRQKMRKHRHSFFGHLRGLIPARTEVVPPHPRKNDASV